MGAAAAVSSVPVATRQNGRWMQYKKERSRQTARSDILHKLDHFESPDAQHQMLSYPRSICRANRFGERDPVINFWVTVYANTTRVGLRMQRLRK